LLPSFSPLLALGPSRIAIVLGAITSLSSSHRSLFFFFKTLFVNLVGLFLGRLPRILPLRVVRRLSSLSKSAVSLIREPPPFLSSDASPFSSLRGPSMGMTPSFSPFTEKRSSPRARKRKVPSECVSEPRLSRESFSSPLLSGPSLEIVLPFWILFTPLPRRPPPSP